MSEVTEIQTGERGRGEVLGPAPVSIVVGDSCRHDLLILPPGGDGEPFRPETWLWLDARTRRILAWWSGSAESVDLGARTALHYLIATHGAPGAVVLDNSRAANVKGVSDMLGLLGVRLEHRAKGTHGPERALRRLDEAIDRHARAGGALDWDTFIAVLINAAATHNEAVSHD